MAKGLQKLYKSTHEREIAATLSQHFLGDSQVIEWLVWQLKELPRDRLLLAIHHANEIISLPENILNRQRAFIALSRIIFQLVKGDSKAERANDLCSLFNTQVRGSYKYIRKTTLSGRVRSIDFSNVIFDECTLNDIEFHGCKFSDTTAFQACAFEGTLDFTNCEGIINAVLISCKFSPDAEITWSRLLSTSPSTKVRLEFAEESLTRALKKFKGDYGFHGIQYRRRNNSANPRNPYNTKIWDTLKQFHVIESHTISGVNEGGLHICEDKDFRRQIAQYLDNGIVGPILRDVITCLIEE